MFLKVFSVHQDCIYLIKNVTFFESCVTAPNGRFKVAWEDELGACSPTKHGIGVWLQYGPVQLTADISWYKSRSFIVCIIPRPNCTTFSLLFHHSVISARSRRTQLLMLFGIALHCRDFGLACLIGTRRTITELDVELAIFGFSQHTSTLPKAL